MKKKYLAAEFAAIFILFALPPLFAKQPSSAVIPWKPGLNTLVQLAVAALLDVQCGRTKAFFKTRGFKSAVSLLVWWPLSLGTMMLVYAAVCLVCALVPGGEMFYAVQSVPSAALQWGMLAVNLAAGAFFDFVLYREFLPETAILLGAGGRLRIAAEVTVIAVFAFSHLYIGNSGRGQCGTLRYGFATMLCKNRFCCRGISGTLYIQYACYGFLRPCLKAAEGKERPFFTNLDFFCCCIICAFV